MSVVLCYLNDGRLNTVGIDKRLLDLYIIVSSLITLILTTTPRHFFLDLLFPEEAIDPLVAVLYCG